MATSESCWIALFPTMSTGMKVQMICNPPATLDKTRLFRVIFDLPFNERNKLLRNIPRNTLKSLILSLPKQTQQSYLKMMASVLQKNKNNNNNNNNNTNTDANNRDRKLKAALNNFDTITNPNINTNTIMSRTGIGRRKSGHYISHNKMRKKLEKLSSIYTKKKINYDSVDAISDYSDENDRTPDDCSKHINYNQFKKEQFLFTIIKMMRAFGDGPRPSRYSALIVLNHIKSYLKCIINKMQLKRKNKQNKKKVLDILEIWYPKQVKVFKKWKYFKYESKKHDKKAPDLLNSDDENDEEQKDSNSNNFLETLKKENNKNDFNVIYVSELDIDIGCGQRLHETDKFTASMDKRQYFKYSKCREASLTHYKKKFYTWLNIKPYSKILTYFFGFLAWDRIGCIVQIARKLNGAKNGVIMQGNDFLQPTQIVKAILKVNGLKQITPFEFIDHSFARIDLTHVQLKSEQNNNKGENQNRKRTLKQSQNEYENDINNDNNINPTKKRRLN